jgi:hypothetical protein
MCLKSIPAVTVPILFTINILKHWTIFVIILDELMTKQYNANLAKETSYYLLTYTLRIYTGLKMVRTSLAF